MRILAYPNIRYGYESDTREFGITCIGFVVSYTWLLLNFSCNKEESCLSRNQYEELHKRCGPYTKSYNRSIKQLVSGQIDDSTDCRYVVWVAFFLLNNQEKDMGGLFCEPFQNTSWILLEDFLFKSEINSFEQNYNYSYRYMLKSNIINYSTELLPSYMFLYFKVPWLIMKSNVYFLPSLFLISSFEQELSKLFPDKETVFHHLGRYLFQPSNLVWRLITQYYQDYLAKAEKRIGIQIRVFDAQTSPFEYVMDQILKLKNIYGEHPTKTGEMVAIYQPSHEEDFSDELVTSAWSTFGYVAQGLGGMRPWILYKINQTKPDPLCGRGMSMEPCYHAPPVYGCKAKTTVDTTTLVPHVRHCEDIRWGIKLFNSSS
ncbi:hypothetical protein ACOSQ2_032442 [Xanthoceras sorbifolium]